MQYRHEWKHEISYGDLVSIRQRLRAVMQSDPNTIDGKYLIRSLYFDNAYDKALREKIDGVNMREKFRIRYYNGDLSYMKLEKKSKVSGLESKFADRITAKEARKLLDGDTEWMNDPSRKTVMELYLKMKYQGMRPRTIVDYTREPFIYVPGNVRVTFDYNIRTALRHTDFLDWDCPTIPAGDAGIILEVKWDNYLPDVIRDIIQTPARRVTAFSKYAQCRIYD
ncbi:MAG: polyphosphate polymerase domain-containing protein [Erysipelotrichaceae bacterium]|nr:polyphosphate polymerase domain-containing protein [Erysipelotrichaceae bacterium]